MEPSQTTVQLPGINQEVTPSNVISTSPHTAPSQIRHTFNAWSGRREPGPRTICQKLPQSHVQQPIRAPRGPDGSGRGGFGFTRMTRPVEAEAQHTDNTSEHSTLAILPPPEWEWYPELPQQYFCCNMLQDGCYRFLTHSVCWETAAT